MMRRVSTVRMHPAYATALASLLGAVLLSANPQPVAAMPSADALAGGQAIPGCACDDDREALRDLRDRIAVAASVDEARELATGETQLASAALGRARWIAPWSSGLASAHDRLDAYQARVALASTPGDIATEFAGLMQLDAPRADIDCDYTTGEIIAIVLGFILGIIPGIILLILLC